MMNKKKFLAFTLIELSVVIIVIGILIAAISNGVGLYHNIKVAAAKSVTQSSVLNSMTDLVLWLEATSKDSLESQQNGKNPRYDDNISAWNDIRITSNFEKISLTQVSAGNQPKYIKEGINGLPSLFFDGLNDVLFTNKTPLKAGDDDYTLIAVWQAASSISGRMILSQNGNTVYSMAGMFLPSTTKVAFAGDHCDFQVSVKSQMDKNIVTIVVDNSLEDNVSIYINSNNSTAGKSSVGTCAGGQNLNLSGARFNIGSQSNGGQYFYGNISEVIIFDRNLYQEEVAAINSYLGQKYGVKIND